MGILNRTPDSFSDGGQYTAINVAIERVQAMIDEGADIIDIGGESTRPGSDPVSDFEQLERIMPIFEAIGKKFGSKLLLSIDTTSCQVAEAALNAGARIINDVSAGLNDHRMFSLAADREAPIILMHSKGTPKTMQENPFYFNVIQEILDSLKQRIELALKAGIKDENIAIDPGIGFSKRQQDNLELLAHLDKFVATGFPVLLGTSRKRFMGSLCAVNDSSDLVTATAVTTALGIMSGVKMFRVHDIKENRQAADITWAIKQRQ